MKSRKIGKTNETTDKTLTKTGRKTGGDPALQPPNQRACGSWQSGREHAIGEDELGRIARFGELAGPRGQA
jgi:hypothetical protein